MHSADETKVLSSPSLNLFFNLDNAIFYQKNDDNVIYELTQQQLPAMNTVSMLNIKLGKNKIVEPHWHPNTIEIVFVTCGCVVVSVLNPFTDKVLTYTVKPNQAVYLPMGWWHWIIATEDPTAFTAQFDNANPQTVFGSEILKKTPKEVFQLAYGVNGEQFAKVLELIREPVVIGPPAPSANSVKSKGHLANWSDGVQGMYGDQREGIRETGEDGQNAIRWRIGGNQSRD